MVALSNAPRMPATLDLAQLGLRPVHVETVAGAIYVCLAEQPPLFGEFRDSIAPLLAPHDLANAKLVFESTLVERANWKLVMENARECYHCSARHPELAVTFPVRGRRSVQFADVECFERFRSRMSQVGLPVGPADGAWWQAMRFPLNDGAITLSMDGQPACTKLMCDVAGGDIGTMRWALEPHCFVHATSDVVFMFHDGERSFMIGCERVIVAAGRRDMGLAFPGWELPGVLGITAAERLLLRYDVLDARRVVGTRHFDRGAGCCAFVARRRDRARGLGRGRQGAGWTTGTSARVGGHSDTLRP